ncbi:MAG: Uma2 family endonuclease [Acidobacteriia bacterium]|nr:Uma2 family endonuclease [Terriglobia bacterium]
MATGHLISVREYLSTVYRPDCDYVDGVVVERNLGEYDHARLQMSVLAYFYAREKQWGVIVVPEQRVQVSPTRFRIPDVCVVKGEPTEQIFRTPPLICIEVLSPDDRLAQMHERVQDYLKFGVPYVFILDPAQRKAWRSTLDGLQEVTALRTADPEIVVPLAELFR